MANRRFIDFPIASSVGDSDIVLIWQDGMNKQTTKGTLIQGAPTSLEGLTDVDIAGLINGQILQYNSTTGKWENVDRTDINLSELGDVSIVSPTNGQVLVYNSSTSKWENSSGGYVPYTGAVTTVNLGSQTIQAGSFVKAGGTSGQFLKADGSIDSNTYGTGTVTSVGLTMPTAFSVANSPVTTTGTLAVTATGTTSQYIRGDGSLATFPALTGFVPYTGATADVNLGTFDLLAERGTFANNGSSDTLTVNHTSGSGYGIIVTKGGNNEALYVSKTSGSGNAMTVVGGRTSLVDLALSTVTNTAGDFLTISGGVVHKRTAAQTLTDIGGQAALTNPVTGTGTTNYLPKFTGASTIGNSIISEVSGDIKIGTTASFTYGTLMVVQNSVSAPNYVRGLQIVHPNGTGATGGYISMSNIGSNIGAIQVGTDALVGPLVVNPVGGNLLVGTTTDAGFKLDVNGTGRFSGALTVTSNVTIRPTTGYNAFFQTSGTALRINYLNDALSANISATYRAIDFGWQDSGGNSILTLASTGAATFSSSVTAKSPAPNANALEVKYSGNSNNMLQLLELGTGTGVEFNLRNSSGTAITRFNTSGDSFINGGRVGVGTNSPSANLNLVGDTGALNGNYRYHAQFVQDQTNSRGIGLGFKSDEQLGLIYAETNAAPSNLAFMTYSGSAFLERMRITSGGNVLIGTETDSGQRLKVSASINGEVAIISNERNSTGDIALVTSLGSNCDNTSGLHFLGAAGGSGRIYIYGNGNIVNINGSYGTLSDISLKENIKDATPKLEDILKLKVRNFNLIGSEEKQIGFIAQELEEIFPKMVDINGSNQIKIIKTSVLVPMLVKAIQELKQEIDTLKN
jgi:hypothetical protein